MMLLNRIALIYILPAFLTSYCFGQTSPSIKSILLEQLKNTHTNQNWFVPLKQATQGLTADQANWKDTTDNHSIGQLVSHLIFYNERVLNAFQGNNVPDFTGENEETFKELSDENWNQAIRKLDSIQTRWYQSMEQATDEQISKWGATVANICSHNAYHTGQIIYIRKRNGWWSK